MAGIIVFWVVIILLVSSIFRRPRFWNPFRGAPALTCAIIANIRTSARMEQLRDAELDANALAVPFGPINVPLETLQKPVILFGLPGSGKTSLMHGMIPSLFDLYRIRKARTRFVFLDVKNELPARLHALLPSDVPLYLLNPLDARAAVLDFPKAFRERSDLDQLADALSPPLPGDQAPFFRNATRQAISLVARTLQKHQSRATRSWGLFDLCSILADKRTLRRFMALDYESKTFYRATLNTNAKSAGDVLSTIRTVISPLIPAALAEQDDTPRFDLRRFLREDGVAVLGLPPTGSQAVLPLYHVLIRRLVEEAQTLTHPDDRLFLFLDELALLHRDVAESIVKASCVGRGHGIHLIAATQSLELLEARMGRDHAHAFLASCATTVGFRCGSRKSAEFIVGRMGSAEGIILLNSWTSSPNGSSSSTSQQLQIRPEVMAEEVLHLPLADPLADRLEFVAVSPAFGNVRAAGPFLHAVSVPTDPAYPNVLPRTTGLDALRPLTEHEWISLGLPRGHSAP
jgi:hypothetical protein